VKYEEKKRFQGYENNVLRKIFGLIRNEFIGGQRILFLVTRVMTLLFTRYYWKEQVRIKAGRSTHIC
jgi:hypothetical protein